MTEPAVPSRKPGIPAEAVFDETSLPRGLNTFRSLRHRDFRLIWTGTLFSSSGQWIQQVTIGWLAYQLTGSGFLLGAVNGFRALPLLFLGPFGGVAADRFDRKRLMLATQLFLLVTSALMATVILTGQLEVWHLFAFTLLTGVAWAFNMPVRQSVVPNLVPKPDLMNALALNSAGFNVTRIVGPSLAGILIAKVGPGENFVIQAFTYFCVVLTISMIRVPDAPRSDHGSISENLAEGGKYVWHHPTLRIQMLLALVPVVVGLPYIALLPIFATRVLHRGAGGFGILMAAPGIGAVLGTLTIASLSNIERKGRLLIIAIFLLGLSLVFFAVSRTFLLSFVLLISIGACQMVYTTTNQTMLQLTIPDHLRGRVMGIYMLNQGLLPLGTLVAGALSDLISAPTTVLLMGSSIVILAIVFGLGAKQLREA